jgi:uncharacterized protein (TIGR03437 family)
MKRFNLSALTVLCGAASLSVSVSFAQAPDVGIEYVTNGATPDAFSGTSQFSQNCFISIFGANLSNSSRSWAAADFVNGALPTSLDGVSVTVNGKRASLSYISPGQLNVLTPVDNSVGPVTVQVTNNGRTASVRMNLVKYSPGLFVWNGQWVVATHTDFTGIAPVGTFSGYSSSPAKPGEIVILWGTGLGPTNPPLPSGVLPNAAAYVTDPVTVNFGSLSVPAMAVAISPGLAGIYQVAVQVPASVTVDTKVSVTIGGVTSNSMWLSMGNSAGGGGGKK